MTGLAYRDPSLAVDDRAVDLLARMTMEEKLAQLVGVWLTLDPEGGDFAPYQGQLAFPAEDMREVLVHGVGQICRPLGSRPISPREGAAAINAFQRRMVEQTRLGFPALVHEECLTGLVTEGAAQFPCPLNWGSTFDPDLIAQIGTRIGAHMRSIGAHQGLGPVADVVRDARWGRVEECVSEDPLHVGAVVCAYVRGLQSQGVAATLKHFAGYGGSEGGRNMAPLHAGWREMRDVHLVPFEMAVRAAGALSVMNAYNEVDGEPAAASRRLLTDILRGEWGFDGVVVADYYAVNMLKGSHGVAADDAEAAAKALHAGLDLELPTPICYLKGLPEALRRGLLAPADIDEAVRRVLRLKLRLGLLERPYVDEAAVVVATPEDADLARRVAERSLVLAKNDGVLPLAPGLKRVAVIGPNADDGFALFGNYSYPLHVASHFPHRQPPPATTVVDALRGALGDGVVSFAQGCRIVADPFAAPAMSASRDGVRVERENLSDDRSGIAVAVEAARRAEVAIVVVGDRSGHFRTGSVGEGTDTDDLGLPGVQTELVEAVLETGTPVVLVLICGRPLAIASLVERAAAVMVAWLPGPEGAAAIADALTGRANPSGKLPVSFIRSAGIAPYAYNHKPIASGLPVVRRFDPLFAFGHGLGYARFDYSDVAGPSSAPLDGEAELSVTIRNAGDRAGAEVVQLYARDPVASVTRPVLELKGFQRVALEPGAAARLTFSCPAEIFAFTALDGVRVVEPGDIRLSVGASSADLRGSVKVRFEGAERRVVEGERVYLARCEVAVLAEAAA